MPRRKSMILEAGETPPRISRGVLSEGAVPSIAESAAKSLGRLVEKAMAAFEAGKDPDSAFRELDITPFTILLSLEPSAAAGALFSFMERSGDERMAACMFVSSAIIALDHDEPLGARRCIAAICREAEREPSFEPSSRLVLVFIADMAGRMEESLDADPSVTALGFCCIRRLAKRTS